MHIKLPIFGLVFQKQEKPYENEIHWIMFYNYQSKSTDIHLNLQFDFSPWLYLK